VEGDDDRYAERDAEEMVFTSVFSEGEVRDSFFGETFASEVGDAQFVDEWFEDALND
jgi:hypothetical protein